MLRYVQACETKDSSDCFIHTVVKKRVKKLVSVNAMKVTIALVGMSSLDFCEKGYTMCYWSASYLNLSRNYFQILSKESYIACTYN